MLMLTKLVFCRYGPIQQILLSSILSSKRNSLLQHFVRGFSLKSRYILNKLKTLASVIWEQVALNFSTISFLNLIYSFL